MNHSEDERQRTLDEIRATYSRYGQEGRSGLWDLSNPGHRRSTEQRDAALLRLVLEAVRSAPGGRLLDVGCGGGDLASLVSSAGVPLEIVGIDLMPERVDVARDRVPGATFVVGSADEIPFDDGTFDVTAAITLFSSLPSSRMESAVAAEISRVTRSRGYLLWYDIRYPNPWNASVHAVPSGRIHELFPGWTGELRSSTLLPPVARRLARSTPVLYPVLHALRPFRSHLIGRLQKPD